MAGIKRTFFGLDSATLAELKTAYVDALKAVALGQSYSISGRSLQRADLAEIKDTIREITAAQANANGTRVTSTLVNFSHATR